MSNTQCYIIDDDKNAIELLSRYISITPGLELLGATTQPVHAVNMITRCLLKPDIVFLDIEMPGLSGDEAAPLLLPFSEVIFTTAHAAYALQAFNLSMADYLHKPFEYPRFLLAVNKVMTKIALRSGTAQPVHNEEDNFLFLRIGGQLVKIPYRKLLMIESQKHKVDVHLTDNVHTAYISIAEMEEALSGGEFMRIHKRYIINLSKIMSIDGSKVTMEAVKCQALIGPTYQEAFIKRIGKNG